MTNKKAEKSRAYRYVCDSCLFKCNDKRDYERHLMTAKHQRRINPNKKADYLFTCKCGKEYKHMTSLCNHKKKCTYKPPEEMIAENLKQQLNEQKEEQRQRDEEHKQQIEILTDKISGMSLVTNHITNNVQHVNNNVNVIENLNYFLNTQCKDAMDLSTFLRSIKVVKEDVDYFSKHGYLKGMEMMFQKYLYSLKVEERPIHCTDKKRKVIYYKDGDCWKKDTEKLQLRHIINNIECKNVMYIENIHSKRRPEELEHFETKAYQWYLKSIEATTGGTHGTANINHSRVLNMLTDEIYVKVVQHDLLKSS